MSTINEKQAAVPGQVAGMDPQTATNPPGADFGTNVIAPKTEGEGSVPNHERKHQEVYATADDARGKRADAVRYGGLSGDRLIWAITGVSSLGFLLFGYDQGLMSGIIASKNFNDEFPATRQNGPDDVYHGTIQGTTVSIYEVGAFFGAVFSFVYGERLGRLKMMFIGAIIMIIGTIISVTAFGPHNGFAQFLVSRVVTGVGNGMNTATIPSWLAECSKSHNRGFLVCVEASMVAVGTVIAYWVDFGFSYLDSSVTWRFPIAFQIFFAMLLMLGIYLFPESPRWLLSHGRNEEGLRVIAALNGVPIDHPAALYQQEMILESIASNQSALGTSSIRKLLIGGKQQNLRRVLIGASSQVFQQLGGCNAVIYYSTILFENQIGLETRLSLILGGVLSVVYALAALTSFLLVERCGRRNLFLYGTVGQAVAMFITFGCLVAGGPQNAKGAAFGLYFFIMWFGATWLPLPWLYPAELNSQAVRTTANAVSTMANWLFNFLVVQVLPTMTASIGSYTFLLFALANCIFFPIIYIFYPETTGRELSEIDVIFAHAHLAKRRPTLIADELPRLTGYQIEKMHEKYDIHGEPGDIEATNASDENMDLSLPPTEQPTHGSSESPASTRVPSMTTGDKGI